MNQPVVIVGAPRSGTNMLRDVLTSAPGVTTWPCDEINFVWKHHNLDLEHDEIPASRADRSTAYLQEQFARRGRRDDADIVIEKTCATSLRVPFVAGALPEAKFIFIRRDGLDATASTMKRWNAEFDLGYTLRKVRFVPPTDFPRHLRDFAVKRVKQRVSGDARSQDNDLRVSTWWGPRPHDFRELQRDHPLEELAFIQWQRCVEQAADSLSALPEDRVLEVVYEDYVADPREGTRRCLEFMGLGDRLDATDVGRVNAGSVGKGRSQLGPDAVTRIEALGGPTLGRFGYA
ncbi:sulfotransferase family protein [Janibacter corallicola]|uniref:sulfotransferase family protein n=1 Tax=Janibacter corallicola TaxID=415212 RepID=UPI00083028E6|nr:sulfotransferase [Janibacter corallicola]